MSGRSIDLLKSVLHNGGVIAVGFGFALIGKGLDRLLGIREFRSTGAEIAGAILLAIGFLLRVWATVEFYHRSMKVISLKPQKSLVTSGPFRWTRNPLFLGGNVFIFLGAVLIVGSPAGIGLTVLNILFVDWFIRREEKQLAREFGQEWVNYRQRVGRWV